MNVIPPLTITDNILTSSSVAEPSAPEVEWSSVTAYTVGQEVILTSTHRKYECLVANTNFNPATNTTGATPKWLDVGPTNRWAMFDLLRNSATTSTGTLEVILAAPNRVNSLAILGAVCSEIIIEVYKNTSLVYYKLIQTEIDVTNWYDYFFNEISYYPSIVVFDIPPFTGAIIKVTLNRGLGEVSCGGLVIGKYVNIGDVQVDATSEALNFSAINRDIYGNALLVPRRNVPKTNQTLFIKSGRVNTVRLLRDKLNAQPAVWSGFNDSFSDSYFEALLILGYYREFSINLDTPISATVSLELEEI